MLQYSEFVGVLAGLLMIRDNGGNSDNGGGGFFSSHTVHIHCNLRPMISARDR